jgi:hypothetical protein
MLVPAIMAFKNTVEASKHSQTEVFRCVKAYVQIDKMSGDSPIHTEYHVNLHRLNTDVSEVFIVNDEPVFAQFEPNRYYEVRYYSMGSRKYITTAKSVSEEVAKNGESL